MKRLLRATVTGMSLLALVALTVGGCSSKAAKVAKPVDTTSVVAAAEVPVEAGAFQMGIEPWLGYGGWLVADKQGYFKANGVDVKIASFTTDDEINAALVAGKLDGANIATHTALRLKSEGTPISIVTVLDQSNEADAIIAKRIEEGPTRGTTCIPFSCASFTITAPGSATPGQPASLMTPTSSPAFNVRIKPINSGAAVRLFIMMNSESSIGNWRFRTCLMMFSKIAFSQTDSAWA